jgi:thiosulfate/3-mercaptopyruvate sulfurtransferase
MFGAGAAADNQVMYTTLISAAELQTLMATGSPLLLDCSFDLTSPDAGREQFAACHLPGALHADLARHLSSHDTTDRASGGRHPLPSRETFARTLNRFGLRDSQQVVVYDRQGANHCGRLWWMLKWCGHEAVAVLDGGLQAWQAAGGALADGDASPPAPGSFALREPLARLVDTATIARTLGHPSLTLVDARAAARFRGEVEPLDPVAGHIPGALNRPFVDNMGPDGRFKPASELRAEFVRLLGARDPAGVTHQCGSGVSAIPNLLAMEIAGLGRSALYAGSWSEWCTTPGLPCAQGIQVAPG